MIKIRKFYIESTKKMLLTGVTSLFISHTYAQSVPTTAQLFKIYSPAESTNIKTEGYIWKFILHAHPDSKTVSAKLLNPHPELIQLNQRALEMAKATDFITLQSTYNSKKMHEEDPKKIRELTDQDAFSLEIKFVDGPAYTRAPRFTRSQIYIHQICKFEAEAQQSQQIKLEQSNQFTLQILLQVSQSGQPQQYKILTPISDTAFLKAFDYDLKSARFYPYNHNGQPTSFTVKQPFTFKCPEIAKYENNFK